MSFNFFLTIIHFCLHIQQILGSAQDMLRYHSQEAKLRHVDTLREIITDCFLTMLTRIMLRNIIFVT